MIVPLVWPLSTQSRKKNSSRLSVSTIVSRNSRSCGAISRAEFTSMQPLRSRSPSERRRMSSKNDRMASRGGKRLALGEPRPDTLFDIVIECRAEHRPLVAVRVLQAGGGEAGPLDQIFDRSCFVSLCPETLHRSVQHLLLVEFPRSRHSPFHFTAGSILPSPATSAIIERTYHNGTRRTKFKPPGARHDTLANQKGIPSWAGQQLEEFKQNFAHGSRGRPALYEVKIDELRSSFALETAVG